MKIKRIILSIISALILMALSAQNSLAVDTVNITLMELNANSSTYVNETNPEYALSYDNYAITQIGDESGKRKINAYCGMANVGFENRTALSGTAKYKDIYTNKYNMSNDNDKLLINGLGMYTSNYNQILALADLFYLGDSDKDSAEFQAYIKSLYEKEYTYNGHNYYALYDDGYSYDELKTYSSDRIITPNEVRAVQQVALWYFTNDDVRLNVDDNTSWDDDSDVNNEKVSFLYYRTTSNTDRYIDLSSNGNGAYRNNMAKQLYKYLVRQAKTNAANAKNGNYVSTNTVYLYTNANVAKDKSEIDNTKSQPVIEIEPGKKEFDLALRKYISSVTSNGATTNYTTSGNRMPNVDSTKLKDGSAKTATYKHKKDPIVVKKGDKVTYAITIYNEGDKKGKATEIKDQLPAGLQYNQAETAKQNDNSKYTFNCNSSTNLLTITANDRELNAYSGTGNPDSTTVYVVCDVTEQPDETEYKILTNIAWISKALDAEKSQTSDNPYSGSIIGHDRDSAPGDYPKNGSSDYTKEDLRTTNSLGYTGKTNYTSETDLSDATKYYEGQQDDDDFEKVKVMPKRGSYDIYIVKQDAEGKNLSSKAKFSVKGPGDTAEKEKEVTGELKFTGETPVKINASNVNTPDVYTIKEIQAPDKYCKFDGTITVTVNKAEDDSKYYASSVTYDVKDSSGSSIKSEEKVKVELKDGNLYVYVKNYQFDLALRKYITQINGSDIKTSRKPSIAEDEKNKLATDTATYDDGTTLAKTHTKTPLEVAKGDKVTYAIEIYNEGEIDGYATEVTDYLPDGLDFLPSDPTNINNGWTQDTHDPKKITTNKLAEEGKLLSAFNKSTKELDSEILYIVCQVNDKATSSNLKNIAEITETKDSKKKDVEDRDSTPNDVHKDNYTPEAPTGGKGEQDDDDFEDLKIVEFDLALRKYITKIEDEKGTNVAKNARN